MSKRIPGIPEPVATLEGLYPTVLATKQAVETIAGHRKGSRITSGVTWQDLVDLGLIEIGQVPRD